MVRTQIELTEEQVRELKKMAAERDMSMAELIRRSLDRTLDEGRKEDEKWRLAMSPLGRHSVGPPDVSNNHDKYVAENSQ